MEPNIYINKFEKRLKITKPFAIFSICLILYMLCTNIFLLTLVALGRVHFDNIRNALNLSLYGFLTLSALLIIPMYFAHKCPKCKKFMNFRIDSHCPLCGIKIRNK